MSMKNSVFAFVILLLLSGCVSQTNPEGYKDPDDFDPVAAAKTRISLGLTYLKNGNYTQAKFNLDKALQFAPRLADAHFSMAYYYQLVDETQQAEEAYQQAMDLDPRNADIANTYGAFLCQQGKYPEAKKYFMRAVNSDNYISTAETYENMALCSQSYGQLDDAMTYLQNALNHQPGRAKSLLLLAEIQISEKRWEDARQTLRRYEKVARISADTLWMSARIEHALGNTRVAEGYGNMLVSMYPGHPYTRQYLNQDFVPDGMPKANKTSKTVKPKEAQNQPQAVRPTVAEPRARVSSTSTEVTPKLEPLIEAPKAPPVPEQVTYHIVQKDENLYRISLQYNIRMQRLIEWNNLSDASAIYAGKKLIVVDPATIE